MPQEKYVAFHVRWGDKLRNEAFYDNMQTYVDQVLKLSSNETAVYLATSDESAFIQARAIFEHPAPLIYMPKLYWQDQPRGTGLVMSAVDEGKEYLGLLRLLFDIDALLQSYKCVVSFSSNMGRFVNYYRYAKEYDRIGETVIDIERDDLKRRH